jgi:hypothetical protein
MEMAYFALIYAWVDDRINTFRDNFMQNAMSVVASVAVVLFTAWIMVQGFRILTGQSREPLMGLVVNASRNTLILIAAGTMALGGSSIQTFFTDTMASGINGMVTGNNDKPEKVIDKNLAYTAVAMAAIDGAQGLNDVTSADNVAAAGRASLIAMLGVAGPPMTAAAMLLMYKVALALFIGLGPIFHHLPDVQGDRADVLELAQIRAGHLVLDGGAQFHGLDRAGADGARGGGLVDGQCPHQPDCAWRKHAGPDQPGDAARGHWVVDDDAADFCAADGGGVLWGDDGQLQPLSGSERGAAEHGESGAERAASWVISAANAPDNTNGSCRSIIPWSQRPHRWCPTAPASR